ncbi:MAG: Na+/H+ antiporter subunit E [Thiohalomonadaceae bacterium]
MIAVTWNFILALVWAALWGDFSGGTLVVGFIIGYLVLAIALRDLPDFARYVARVPKAINFFLYFNRELLKSNLKVAYDVLTRTHYMKPGVIAFALRAEKDGEIAIVANLISLTPGTLSLDVSSDRRVLYIHVMYLTDEAQVVDDLRDLERRILDILR